MPDGITRALYQLRITSKIAASMCSLIYHGPDCCSPVDPVSFHRMFSIAMIVHGRGA